jgi:NAD(P)-dependent dehydrogenase (short-subunit alcohol dehydrogenase family)
VVTEGAAITDPHRRGAGLGRLAGRIALISGSARGLGAAIADLFAREGAAVMITDIRDEEGEKTADRLTAAGAQARYRHLDVTAEKDWDDGIAACAREFGHEPDVLVSNAFVWSPGTAAEVTLDAWNTSLAVNLTGGFLGFRAVLPSMRSRGRGTIVAIGSSMGGEVAAPDFASYQAAKAGLAALVRHIAVTYGREGIRANLVHPGPMYTPGVEEAGFTSAMQQLTSAFPLPRVASPEEVAYSALFLASDESSYITGSAVVPDGGSSIGL